MSRAVLCPSCSSWDTKHVKTEDSGEGTKAPISRIYTCKQCKCKFQERYDLKFVRVEKID